MKRSVEIPKPYNEEKGLRNFDTHCTYWRQKEHMEAVYDLSNR